jgi:hypothetical protein
LTQEKLPLGEAETSKTPLDGSSQKAAAGVVAHQHRTTCVSKRVAYCEVEHLLIGGRSAGSLSTFTPTAKEVPL